LIRKETTIVADMKVVVGKRQFFKELGEVESVLTEYERFLRAIPSQPDWETRAIELAREHQRRLSRARASLQTVELLAAMLQRALTRVSAERLRIHWRGNGEKPDGAAPIGPDSGERAEKLSLLVGELHGLAQQAPLAMQEKLRILLSSISSLFGGLLAGAGDQVEEATDQINLLTSSRESQNLIREIAYIARDIYNSLNAFSANLPLQDLSDSAEGISEAVRKLKSVIQRLEQAANQNLDALEAHLHRVENARSGIDELLKTLRESQQMLGMLKLEHPQIAERITRLQDDLGDGIGSRVMLLRNRAEINRESLISMTANQSFQDLTGQTLKKIIAFIENLQIQIVKLLEKYRPVLGLTAPKSGPPKDEAAARERQSQDQVDALLADLGF
jgi:chemotaxis protein CheZ